MHIRNRQKESLTRFLISEQKDLIKEAYLADSDKPLLPIVKQRDQGGKGRKREDSNGQGGFGKAGRSPRRDGGSNGKGGWGVFGGKGSKGGKGGKGGGGGRPALSSRSPRDFKQSKSSTFKDADTPREVGTDAIHSCPQHDAAMMNVSAIMSYLSQLISSSCLGGSYA